MSINTIVTKNNAADSPLQPKKTDKTKHADGNAAHNTANTSGKASLSPDLVNLTDSALQIKTLEAQIARLPIVDTQKIEKIQNSINDGTFEFNFERIAEKFINIERELQ